MVRGDDTNRNIWIACIDKPTAILTVVLKFIFICLNYCLDRLLIFRNRCLLCWQTFCCCILRFSPNPIFTDKITIRGCGVGHHISVCSHIIPGTVCVLIPFIYQVGTIRVLYLPPPPASCFHSPAFATIIGTIVMVATVVKNSILFNCFFM